MDRRLKSILALVLALAMVFTLAMGCTTTEDDADEEEGTTTSEPTTDVKAAMVTDVGGLGDKSFNDLAHAGLIMGEDEYGMEIEVLESNEIADYEPNVDQLVNAGYDVIYTVGFLMTDTTNAKATEYPDALLGANDLVIAEPADNQVGLLFKENEASYLAGVVAGMMTMDPTLHDSLNDANTIGFVGGMEIPPVQKFEAGYIAGARSVNPDVEVISLYVGNFEDTAKAKELGLTAIEKGADIVFAAAGLPGAGVAQACVEKGALFIGVDADQFETLPEAQDVIITSAIKRVDQAVFLTTQSVVEGTFESGIHEFGLADDGVGLAPYHNFDDVITQEIKDAVDSAAADVIDGTVVVPSDPSTL